MYRLIDTHAHLEEVPDLPQAIERAREAGVIAIVAVGVDYQSNNQVLELAAKHRPIVLPALGCHPGNIPDNPLETERNFQFVQDNIASAVAVGEIGLDYHKMILSRTSKDLQKQVLRDILGISKIYDKPALIHSRYAWRDAFDIVRESEVRRAVFHWFTGPIKVLRNIVEAGYFCSATLAAEYHEEHRRTIKETPIDQILLETDSPVSYRLASEPPHPAEPADVARVLKAVVQLKDSEASFIAETTTNNALPLFGVSGNLW